MATTFSIDRFLNAPPLTRVREVQEGLPASALRAVVKDGAVTLADLVDIVGKRRTLDRRLAEDEPLTLEESDRLARFVDILSLTTRVTGDRTAAIEWLRAPQYQFEGTAPLTMMRTHAGSDLVTNLLRLMQHGMLA